MWLGCADIGQSMEAGTAGGTGGGDGSAGNGGSDGGSGGGSEAGFDGGAADTGGGGDGSNGSSNGSKYHPDGFADPAVHGHATKFGEMDCRVCHGNKLEGMAPAPSCDSCHQDGWRTNCTYCHGGTDSDLGAPPRDLDGATDLDSLTFRSHTPHGTENIKAVLDCTHCHNKPTDVLTSGHIFDDSTPGKAEVDFSHGLSPDGTYDGSGTCSNLYCHGNGNGQLGMRNDTQPTPGCGECHADSTTSNLWSSMSGQHTRHLQQGFACSECHGATSDATDSIIQPLLHVDGTAEVVIGASGFTYNNGSCSGTCHGKVHFSNFW